MKFTAKQQREILRVVAEWHPDVNNEVLDDGTVGVFRDELAMELGNAMGLSNERSLTIMESERMSSARRWSRAVQS